MSAEHARWSALLITPTPIRIRKAGSGSDILNLTANANYALTGMNNYTDGPNGLPSVSSVITINGNGATITGSYSRLLHVASNGNLKLNKLKLSNGEARSGGGIFNHGSLTLTNSTVSHNETAGNSYRGDGPSGGGIINYGNAILINSTISGNTAGSLGGGIRNRGMLTLTNSTISGNTANSGSGINNGHFGGS